MKCPECGHVTRSRTSRFCPECGATLPERPAATDAAIPDQPSVIDLVEAPALAMSQQAGTAPPAPPPPPPIPAGPWAPPVIEQPSAPPTDAVPVTVSTGPPPYQPVPPPVTRTRVPAARILRAIGIALAAVLSVGLGIVAVAKQEDRGTALALLAVAWLVALVLIAFGLFRPSTRLPFLARLPIAVVLAGTLVALSVPVVRSSCGERLGANANLRGCDFAGADLAGLDLRGSNFARANLTGANLTSAVLGGANLEGARLTRARASSASFAGARLAGAVFDDTTLQNASFARASVSGASFRRAVLDGAVFTDTSLAGVVFDGARLGKASLTDADLKGASLADATLSDAALDGANLSGAKLDGANLAGASLVEANLDGASLRDADLNVAFLRDVSARGGVLDGARLADADLTGANLDRASLRGTDLSRAILVRASFAGAVVSGVRLDGASLIGATGLSDRALADGVGIRPGDLAGFLTARHIRLEPRDQILAQLGAACRGHGVGTAAPGAGTFHPLVILDGTGGTSTWTAEAASLGWEPMAVRFGQLVSCVTRSETSVQRCQYTEIGGFGRAGSITRYRNRATVRVVGARSGSPTVNRTFEGTQPNACPAVTSFQSNGRIEGSEITFSTVRPALAAQVGHPPG